MDTDARAVELAADQANEWLERLKNPDPQANVAFLLWLRTSPLHVRELLIAAALDSALRGADPNRMIDVPKLLDEAGTITALPVGTTAERQATEGAQGSGARSAGLALLWRLAAGISVLALTVFGTLTLLREYNERFITTEPSEWRSKLLPDGTRVKIGPRSALRVDISNRARHVYISRGEALFAVAHDSKRPFIVHTRRADVRALGTVFGVSDFDGRVLVTVEEGTVAVARSAAAAGIPAQAGGKVVRLAAGQQVAMTEAQPFVVTAVDPSEALAWALGRLVVSGRTIGDVAKEFNRRNLTQIEITDPQLAARRVFGAFEADDPHAFATSVLHWYGQSVAITDRPGRIRLSLLPDAEHRAPMSQ